MMEVGEEYGGGGMAMDDIGEEEEITQEDAWAVISAYFEEKGLVRQQLDSFDEFIQNTMQEIVDESADIEIRPESQHNPARQQDYLEVMNLTYSAPLYVDVTKKIIRKGLDCEEVTETQDFAKVFIGKVPIMLRSSYCTLFQNSEKDLTELGECPYDQGGYFIINGSLVEGFDCTGKDEYKSCLCLQEKAA
ncbi:hypothetical protein J5N97_005232 [Dioscorea zingiberensis]|uniref:DNA-directed RNA polymerase n=1 Tax=Dioscorea zingiberensis TaxID=325984 RepID=A0A9D5D860_9LILI|nr:hypothetical protein J5N97_005232 [Dioscorea zingiberensis]